MERFPKSSGISLPLLLKRRWEYERQYHHPTAEKSASTVQNHDENDVMQGDKELSNPSVASEDAAKSLPSIEPLLKLSHHGPTLTKTETKELSNRVFTAKELEELMWQTNNAMVDIQRQLYRGEEVYYEDTHNHGNIFRGWDAFVDAKDVGGSNAASSSIGQATGRRVPADSRWFSGSCRSISRMNRPVPLSRLSAGGIQDPGHRPSNNPTPLPLSSERSEASTPSPGAVLSTTGGPSFQTEVATEGTSLIATAPVPAGTSSSGTPKESQAEVNSMTRQEEVEVSTLSSSAMTTMKATAMETAKTAESDSTKQIIYGMEVATAERAVSSGSAGEDAEMKDAMSNDVGSTTPSSNANQKMKRKASTGDEPQPKRLALGVSPKNVYPTITSTNPLPSTHTESLFNDVARVVSDPDPIGVGKKDVSLGTPKGNQTPTSATRPGGSEVPVHVPKKRGRPSTKGIGATATNTAHAKTAKESGSDANKFKKTDVLPQGTNANSADSKPESTKIEKKDTPSSKAESAKKEKTDTPRRGRPRRSAK